MPHYMTVHYEPGTPAKVIQTRWIDFAQERRALWRRTWHNLELGKRYCWWDAPDREALEEVLKERGVPWEEILQVDLTTPSEWTWRED